MSMQEHIERAQAEIDRQNPKAQSPFLPGTRQQWVWDTMSLGWAKTCLRLYKYQMIDGWSTRTFNFNLEFGMIYHSALERYDRLRFSGLGPQAALLDVVKWLFARTWAGETCKECGGKGWTRAYSRNEDETDECPVCKGDCIIDGHPIFTFKDESGAWVNLDNNKTRETLVRSVIWNIDQFGERDPAKTITLPNGNPGVELRFQWETEIPILTSAPVPMTKAGVLNYSLSGHLDRVVDFDGDLYVMDRKTTKQTVSGYYFNQFTPDNQMSSYTLAGQIVFKSPVKGVLIEAAQIAVGFTRIERAVVTRTPAMLEEWLKDLEETLRRVERAVATDHWPMNDKACFNCAFRDICSKDPSVREQFLKSNYIKRDWNPLHER